ncbi:MAG: hypothetical protein KDB68_03560 [Planctomycetes bacterium]|nr:hypothetical protein [Planctomycetota bacterium]
MHIPKASLLLLAIFVCAPLWSQGSQGFDAVDFFGPAYQPAKERANSGVLSDSLKSGAPSWINFSTSDNGSARDSFKFAATGLEFNAAQHQTCEALIDVGVVDAGATVSVVELDKGGAVGWHLRDLAEPAKAWLVELKHKDNGSYQLRIRVSTGAQYSTFPHSKTDIETLQLPAELKLTIKPSGLSAEVAGNQSEAKTELKNGVTIGLATTDARSRLRKLSIDLRLHPDWIADANARLLARRTLERLREYATVGLLQGVAAHPHPTIKDALKAYSDAERAERENAFTLNPASRAKALLALAESHPKSAVAQHEAGVAALQAGLIVRGHQFLLAADKLQQTSLTCLALAEAYRRIGQPDEAEEALSRALTDMPDGLQPDYALLRGRLLADRGDIAAARQVLSEASRKYPNSDHLRALSESADALMETQDLTVSNIPGPLGLQLASDLSDAQLKPVMARLKPYIEQIRVWLPDLEETLEGVVAIYASPIEYLHAALLVAGDNLDNIAGMYMPHGIGNGPSVVACRAFGEDELLRTLVHELWHLALASTGHSQAIPRWLDEGMAVFLSAGKYENESMRYSELPTEFGGIQNPIGAITPSRIEFAMGARPQEFYLPGEVHGNYLAAWGVVWFHATRAGGLQFLRDLLTGDPEALRRVNADHARLQQSVTDALKDGIG